MMIVTGRNVSRRAALLARAVRAVVVLALFGLASCGLASCGPREQTKISSTSGPPPKVHEVLNSADGQWALTVVERHPTDPDLHGTTWQVWIGPAGQPIDSTHCIFDAQDIRPHPAWATKDSITVAVTGTAERLADIPKSYHSSETVLGRDLLRHTFAVWVTQQP